MINIDKEAISGLDDLIETSKSGWEVFKILAENTKLSRARDTVH